MEGKTEENAIEWVIEDKSRKYGLCTTKRTATIKIELVSMTMETCPYKGRIQQRDITHMLHIL